MSTRIEVGGEPPYDAVVGHDVRRDVTQFLGDAVRTVVVVQPKPLYGLAEPMWEALDAAGYDTYAVEVPEGEGAKDLAVAAHLWSAFGRIGLSRTDAVIGVGGGATTDIAGFVAATWLRGVPLVQVPTTLLGMVDAAIGGKTAINTAEGKNLVGAFHQPAGVLCDLATLESMPAEEYASGLAEVIKAGFTSDPAVLDRVEADPAAARSPTGAHTRELVERAIRCKAEVVAGDFRERVSGGGGREVLNYGHTLGHAIELVEDYGWRHGAAVSVGMVYAAELARLAGRLDDGTARRHRRVLEAVGLPTAYDAGAWPQLREAMDRDKKTRGGSLRFVVLDEPARPAMLEDPPEELLEAAFRAVTRQEMA